MQTRSADAGTPHVRDREGGKFQNTILWPGAGAMGAVPVAAPRNSSGVLAMNRAGPSPLSYTEASETTCVPAGWPGRLPAHATSCAILAVRSLHRSPVGVLNHSSGVALRSSTLDGSGPLSSISESMSGIGGCAAASEGEVICTSEHVATAINPVANALTTE